MPVPIADIAAPGAEVRRVDFLRLREQFITERILYVRELSLLRNTIQSLAFQQQQLSPSDAGALNALGDDPPPSAATALTRTKRSPSSLAGATAATSPPAVLAPELVSLRALSDALAASQTIVDLQELHQLELAEKDKELAALREAAKDAQEEQLAQCNCVLRREQHEKELLLDTALRERSRFRQEALSEVGDELRQERALSHELRVERKRLLSEIALLQKQVEAQSTEARRLQSTVAQLLREQSDAAKERTECRAALLAMSAEKCALERKTKQLEAAAAAAQVRAPVPPKRRGSRRSILADGEQEQYVERALERRGLLSDRDASLTGSVTQPSLRVPVQGTPASSSGSRARRPSQRADDPFAEVLSFALDDAMARAVSVGVQKLKDQPESV